MTEPKFKTVPYGFDRTQMYKEYEGPMIHRMSAMNFSQKFFESNFISYTPKELKSLYLGFLDLIEKGDMSIFERLDKYLQTKEEQNKTLIQQVYEQTKTVW